MMPLRVLHHIVIASHGPHANLLRSIVKPNAGGEPLLEAGAQRTLAGVACMPSFGA
jgi:hypothetical protein